MNFAKFVRTSVLQNNTGRLFLIIAVSIVAKGVLANENVNYDRKIKHMCINLNQKFKLLKRAFQVKQQVSEAVD